jgi:hypothetical protein
MDPIWLFLQKCVYTTTRQCWFWPGNSSKKRRALDFILLLLYQWKGPCGGIGKTTIIIFWEEYYWEGRNSENLTHFFFVVGVCQLFGMERERACPTTIRKIGTKNTTYCRGHITIIIIVSTTSWLTYAPLLWRGEEDDGICTVG